MKINISVLRSPTPHGLTEEISACLRKEGTKPDAIVVRFFRRSRIRNVLCTGNDRDGKGSRGARLTMLTARHGYPVDRTICATELSDLPFHAADGANLLTGRGITVYSRDKLQSTGEMKGFPYIPNDGSTFFTIQPENPRDALIAVYQVDASLRRSARGILQVGKKYGVRKAFRALKHEIQNRLAG